MLGPIAKCWFIVNSCHYLLNLPLKPNKLHESRISKGTTKVSVSEKENQQCVSLLQPFSGDQMDDFSSELFNSFFDDHLLERPLLADRVSFLHMDIESSPGQSPLALNPPHPNSCLTQGSTLRHCFLLACVFYTHHKYLTVYWLIVDICTKVKHVV